jgi:molybdopterin converting factor small subunit
MNVRIPAPLLSYTGQRKIVQANGHTIAEILDDLNRQFPGIRFRMIDEQDRVRRHMRIFINMEQTFSLDTPVQPTDTIQIIQALSGG